MGKRANHKKKSKRSLAGKLADKPVEEGIPPVPKRPAHEVLKCQSTPRAQELSNGIASGRQGGWIPKIIALVTATLAFLAVLVPRGLGVLSLLVSALGVLGMLSPKTPIAKRIAPLFGEKSTAKFVQHLVAGFKGWALGLGAIALCMVFVYLNFMWILIVIFKSIYSIALILPVLSLSKRWMGQKAFISAVLAVPAAAIVTIALGATGISQIQRGSFDVMYSSVTYHGTLGDPLMSQASSMLEYAELYRKNYTYSAAANRFLTSLEQFREDYSLADEVHWRSERAEYTIRTDTLARLKHSGMTPSTLAQLAPLRDRPFTGASAYERALRQHLEDATLSAHLDHLLEFANRSEQKVREVEMKRAWKEFRQALRDPEVISQIEISVPTRIEQASSSRRILLFPYYLQPEYVASTLILKGAAYFAALAAVLKLLVAWVTWRIFDYGSSLFRVALLLGFLFLCWAVAKRIKAYNAKYERTDDAASASQTFLSFALLTCFSVILAIFTL